MSTHSDQQPTSSGATDDDAPAASDPTNGRLWAGAALVAAVGLLLLGVAALRGAFSPSADPGMTQGEPVLAPVRPTEPASGDAAQSTAADVADAPAAGEPTVPAEEEEAAMTEAAAADGDTAGADAAEAAAVATAAADAAATAATAAGLAPNVGAAKALAKDLGPGWEVVRVVEDWRAVNTAEQIEARITRNLGMGDTELALMPLSSPPVPGPLNGVLGSWRVNEARPNDFVGFNRDLDPPQDWSGGDVLAIWLDAGDRPRGNVVFQFREGAGSEEVWRYEDAAAKVPATGPLLLPLEDEVFAWAPWSRESDGIIQREAIDQYGFYVGHAGPDHSGGFMLGAIAVLRSLDEG